MRTNIQGRMRWIVAAVMLALPLVLLLSSVRSLGELDNTRSLYLRNRAATIAARLENLPLDDTDDNLAEMLYAEEPALVDLRIYRSPEEEPGNSNLQSLWRGEALFQIGLAEVDGEQVYRAYIPFHLGLALRIARVDLAVDSADFLVEHTRHHIVLSLLASLALVGFTVYFLWSERRAVEFQRRRLELEHLANLGKMSAVLAHEIRNPLGTIKGFVQLSMEKAQDAVRGLLTPVLEETARLEKLVNDLLLYGRPREPEPQPTEWAVLAGRLETHAREAIGNGTTQFHTTGDLVRLDTDPEMLFQVLLNLVRNSVEAVAEIQDGEVTLSAQRTGRSGVSIRVEDNGPGLPPEIRDRLFEPFTTTKSNGTGLGLSIARKLTSALGGRLEISPGPDRGLTAKLVFEK
jgi:signal transduction histidine kinase